MNEDVALNYCLQLFRALSFLHTTSVCHRDIKPKNLLIDTSTKVLKVCDFGSAKVMANNEKCLAYICSRYYRSLRWLVLNFLIGSFQCFHVSQEVKSAVGSTHFFADKSKVYRSLFPVGTWQLFTSNEINLKNYLTLLLFSHF